MTAAYERLIEIEHQLGGMYEGAEWSEKRQERSGGPLARHDPR